MSLEELRQYVYECVRIGLDDRQIAAKLGMTEQELIDILNGKEMPTEKPVVKEEKKKPTPKPREVKPVSGVTYIQEEAKKAKEVKEELAEES